MGFHPINLAEQLFCQHALGRAMRSHPALMQHNQLVRETRRQRKVVDHEQYARAIACLLAERGKRGKLVKRIKTGERLVGQQP